MTMRLRKLLGNNAVVVDVDGTEKIVTGCGIGFKRSINDQIDESKVEKVYLLSTSVLNEKFAEILSSLSFEQMQMVEEIVGEIKLDLGRPTSDSIYVSLADHLSFALKNYEANVQVPNGLLLDIKRFYPNEFRLGQRALDIIERHTGYRLPEDEAGFVALHIANAEIGTGDHMDTARKVAETISHILSIVQSYFSVNIAETSMEHYRFINHLRYFAQRLLSNSVFPEDEETRELLSVVSVKYPEEYACAKSIADYAQELYGIPIGCDELFYLTVHIHHAISEER